MLPCGRGGRRAPAFPSADPEDSLSAMPDEAPLEWVADEEDELFLMSNLYPEDTGLPMTIWVSVKGRARHDARVKVNMAHGARMDPDNLAVVSVRPQPRLLHGELSSRDLEGVVGWIELNREAIIDHWEGRASSAALLRRLKPLPA